MFLTTGGGSCYHLEPLRMAYPLFLLLCFPGVVFWDRGCFQCHGKGVVLVSPNFDMGWPIFSSTFGGRFLIQGPGGFGGQGAYSDFAMPNFGISSPLYFPLCFPLVSFKGQSGLLLGGSGPSTLGSNLGIY